MKEEYVIYKGVRMTEQEAEARINNAYCDAADKIRNRAKSKPSTSAAAKPTAHNKADKK